MPTSTATLTAAHTATAAAAPIQLSMPSPSGEQLKAARLAAGLNQAQAAELMGYSLQTGSRGGLQSRTWQALESPTDDRNMQGPVFAMFLLLTGQHPDYALAPKTSETPETPDQRPPESTA